MDLEAVSGFKYLLIILIPQHPLEDLYEIRFSLPSPKKVLLEDLTGDGIKEYAYYERHMTESLQIWSLSTSGIFQPVRFRSHPGDKSVEQLGGMKLCVESADKGQVVIRVYDAPPGVLAPHLQRKNKSRDVSVEYSFWPLHKNQDD